MDIEHPINVFICIDNHRSKVYSQLFTAPHMHNPAKVFENWYSMSPELHSLGYLPTFGGSTGSITMVLPSRTTSASTSIAQNMLKLENTEIC